VRRLRRARPVWRWWVLGLERILWTARVSIMVLEGWMVLNFGLALFEYISFFLFHHLSLLLSDHEYMP